MVKLRKVSTQEVWEFDGIRGALIHMADGISLAMVVDHQSEKPEVRESQEFYGPSHMDRASEWLKREAETLIQEREQVRRFEESENAPE